MQIDEEDITVGKHLYFIKDGNNSRQFVGLIKAIGDETDTAIYYSNQGVSSINGQLLRIEFPMDPGKNRFIEMALLRMLIEDGHVVIR